MEESKTTIEIITKTIITTILYIILSIMILFFIGVYKVDAKAMVFPDMSFNWDDGITEVPTTYWWMSGGETKNETFFVYNWSGESEPMTYIITEWCTENIGMIEEMYISNTNYNTNYINDGTGVTYITGKTCKIGSYSGYLIKKQFQVGLWGDLDDAGEKVAGGYINYTNNWSWNVPYKLQNIYLTDTDELTTLSEEQKSLRETIDSIENQTEAIIENQDKLKEEIKEAILGTGLDEETKKPTNKEQYENTHEKEEELLEEWKPTDEELGNIELEIEQEPANYMWNLLERILNTNERILYLVMSILVVGVIKLIMGR